MLEVLNAVFRIIFRETGNNIIIKLNAIIPSANDPNFIVSLKKEGELRLRKVILNPRVISVYERYIFTDSKVGDMLIYGNMMQISNYKQLIQDSG